ncbi:MAG TPA: VOC family protein [Terriglobales bacterium]|nr:VOC family protein [Terriglobales bacterium]
MAEERTLIEQLDTAVEAIVRGQAAATVPEELRAHVEVARQLRNLPREQFRERLKTELERMANMTTTATSGVRPGFHTITPYLIVPNAAETIEFVKQAFGAEETMRGTGSAGGIHAELRIGDSMMMIGGGGPGITLRQAITPMPTGLHVYVPDTDAAYARALEAGATSLHAVADMPYGERSGSVRDRAGNEWYIATAHRQLPEGMRAVNVYLHPHGVDRLVEFVKDAFGAEEIELHREKPDGPIVHGELRLGDSILEMGEAHGQWLPMPTMLYLYLDDADAAYEKAIAAGAKSLWAPADQPYGDRNAGVQDEWENQWILATHLG